MPILNKIVTAIIGLSFSCASFAGTYTYKPVSLLVKSDFGVAVVAYGTLTSGFGVPYKARIFYYNSSGWLTGTKDYNDVKPTSAVLDSADKVIIGGSYDGQDYFLAKDHSNTSYAWTRTWAGNGGDPVIADMDVDSSDAVYVAGYCYSGTKYDSTARKYLGTGTVSISKSDTNSQTAKWTEVLADTGQCLVVAGVESISGVSKAVGYRFSGAGTILSSVQAGSSVHNVKLAGDSSNKYYLAYTMTYVDRTPGFNEEDVYVSKFTAGSFSGGWTSYVATPTVQDIKLAVDSSANVLVTASDSSLATTSIYKFDSTSGSNSWTTAFTSTTVLNLHITNLNYSYIIGTQAGLFYKIVDSVGGYSSVGTSTDAYRKPVASYVHPGSDGTAYAGVYVLSEITGGAYFGSFLIETPVWVTYQS